jgi:hypothetical protein
VPGGSVRPEEDSVMRRSTPRTILVMAAVAAVLALMIGSLQPAFQPGRGGPGGSKPEVADQNPEAAEQGEDVHERMEALEAAERAGTLGQQRPIEALAAVGWAGEQPFEASAPDDWEPAIAADPSSAFVYALVTRYGTGKPPGCSGNCPNPWIALRISSDGGVTWGATKALCACKGSGQFDPIIEVVPGPGANAGHVYALYMNGYNVMFTKSRNHGQSWDPPVKTYGNVSWNDKPVIAVSDNGQDVYVSFNGPTGGDPWAVVSHDAGATWTQTKLVDSNRYYFAFDADVAPNGTVYFAETSILYGGGGNKGTTPSGTIDEHVFVLRPGQTTWEDHLVASILPGLACTADGCPPDFYLGHSALSVDANNNVVLLYDGATSAGGLQRIYSQRSTDNGANWLANVFLSPSGEEATAPAVESRGSGDVRAWWQQTAGGGNADQWNTWYSSSTNGGGTWTAPVKISDAGGGAAYKTANGYLEIYGDYGEIAITNLGKTIAIWGEGLSYTGPGGVWFNRQP